MLHYMYSALQSIHLQTSPLLPSMMPLLIAAITSLAFHNFGLKHHVGIMMSTRSAVVHAYRRVVREPFAHFRNSCQKLF